MTRFASIDCLHVFLSTWMVPQFRTILTCPKLRSFVATTGTSSRGTGFQFMDAESINVLVAKGVKGVIENLFCTVPCELSQFWWMFITWCHCRFLNRLLPCTSNGLPKLPVVQGCCLRSCKICRWTLQKLPLHSLKKHAPGHQSIPQNTIWRMTHVFGTS